MLDHIDRKLGRIVFAVEKMTAVTPTPEQAAPGISALYPDDDDDPPAR